MTRRRWWLLALSAALAFWSLGGEWVSVHQHVPEDHFLDLLGGLSYLVAGIVALDRRPGNIIGTLMIAYGFIWYLGNWGGLQVPVLPVLGVIGSQLLGPPVLAHIALAYPSGRLQAMFDRVVLGAAYAVAIGASAIVLLTYAPRAGGCTRCAWEPAVFPSSTGVPVDAAIQASHRAAFVLVPLFLAAIWLRWRRATPAERRDLAPLWVALCVIAIIYLLGAFASPDRSDQFSYLLWELQTLLNISVPMLFLWGLLSTRLARSAVGDLVMELDRPLPPGALQASLRRTLGDPSLELLYALEGQDRWVNGHGQHRSLPQPGERHQARMVTLVARHERPLAALIHDPALDQGLVRAAAAAAGIAIENERLHAEIQAQLEEVRASRQRIVAAGDRERRRVERNLHDGAQQRLATLALSLAMLRDREGADPATAASLAQALAELKQAIEELRELARGIHPAILTEEGLPAAVESLADRSPFPVRVAADFDDRLPGPAETAAYFVVSEALANVAKYAHASRAWVELSRCNGTLRVQVLDDGVGGADPARGSGLRGLQDRISAVRGSFRVETPSAGGTRVLAEIPCDA
jgi:signal transduction histidine kinase